MLGKVTAGMTTVMVLLVFASVAQARPTDVSVVGPVAGYPAAPERITLDIGGVGNNLNTYRDLPAGLDFIVLLVTGYFSVGADGGPPYLAVGDATQPIWVPIFDPNGSSFYRMVHTPTHHRVRDKIGATIMFTQTGNRGGKMAFEGYWISETTGQISAPPAGFKADPVMAPRMP